MLSLHCAGGDASMGSTVQVAREHVHENVAPVVSRTTSGLESPQETFSAVESVPSSHAHLVEPCPIERVDMLSFIRPSIGRCVKSEHESAPPVASGEVRLRATHVRGEPP